jgi:hypothetical protein
MRRLFALMLIATSGWLFYRTANLHLGGVDHLLSPNISIYFDEPNFMFPAIGSALGMLGGLLAFFGGPGGATLALLGGVSVAGFALNFDETLELSHFWDNQLSVGVVILMLAAMAASITRASRSNGMEQDDDARPDSSPNRRVF